MVGSLELCHIEGQWLDLCDRVCWGWMNRVVRVDELE